MRKFFTTTNKKLILTIDYDGGLIAVTFENVSLFKYENHDFAKILDNLDTEICTTEFDEDGALEIVIREYVEYPLQMNFWIIKIKAENITVKNIEEEKFMTNLGFGWMRLPQKSNDTKDYLP